MIIKILTGASILLVLGGGVYKAGQHEKAQDLLVADLAKTQTIIAETQGNIEKGLSVEQQARTSRNAQIALIRAFCKNGEIKGPRCAGMMMPAPVSAPSAPEQE